jgi:hypothetical protein
MFIRVLIKIDLRKFKRLIKLLSTKHKGIDTIVQLVLEVSLKHIVKRIQIVQHQEKMYMENLKISLPISKDHSEIQRTKNKLILIRNMKNFSTKNRIPNFKI